MNRRDREVARQLDSLESQQSRIESGINRCETLLAEITRRAYAAHLAMSARPAPAGTAGAR